MSSRFTPTLAPLASALALALSLTACGGGGDAASDSAADGGAAAADVSTPDMAVDRADGAATDVPTDATDGNTPASPTPAPVSDTVQYNVSSAEVVLNNLFTQELTNWTVGDAVLVTSSQRTGGKSLNVGWRALQKFAHGAMVPGASYVVKFRAKNEKTTGTTTVAMKFQIPPYNENFRTYQKQVTGVAGATWTDYSFEFTAPAFTRAELSVYANGSRAVVDSVSVKMRSAIATTEPITSPSGSFAPAGYVLAFNDEFNGTALNRAKWHTRMIYNNGTTDRMHDEKQRYRDNDNHQVGNGVLSLIARKVSSTDPNGINYESGMIRSDWTQRYGYYEARVKMPGGLGVWPAFWLNSDVSDTGRLSWPPEIDIFEFVNNGVEDKVNMLHSGVVTRAYNPSALTYAHPTFNNQYTYWRAPFNFNEGYHVVGAEWTPTSVTMYVDGVKIYTRGSTWTYDDQTLGGPAHILLNLGIGGAWAGRHGIDDAAFPQALEIDWVRAYKKR